MQRLTGGLHTEWPEMPMHAMAVKAALGPQLYSSQRAGSPLRTLTWSLHSCTGAA